MRASLFSFLGVLLLVLLLVNRRHGPTARALSSVPVVASAMPAHALLLASPPPPPPLFVPVCAVDWKRSKCARGHEALPCPKQPHEGATPIGTGAWELTESYVYFLDRGLLAAMVGLFEGGSVLEFGAGKGCYTAAFRLRGLAARGYDGSPQVAALTDGLVQSADLTVPHALDPADWVVCLEVAEHIPRPHEETFLTNLLSHARRGVVLSWSNNEGGNGHVNLRSNEWVAEAMRARQFEHDPDGQAALRHGISDIHWYRETVMVFRRSRGEASHGASAARRRLLLK